MDMIFLNVLLPMMFEGLKLTILIAVVGITIGFLIGSLCGYLLQSKYKIGKAIAEVTFGSFVRHRLWCRLYTDIL